MTSSAHRSGAQESSTAIKVALATFSPVYPLSAKTRWINGKTRREACRSGPPPSLDGEAAALGVNQRVALAPVDLLARIVTAQAAGLGGLDALAVNDRGRRTGVAPHPFAICHHERVGSKRP
jgi:hypothetical protein